MEITSDEISCKGKSCKKKVLNISEVLRHFNNNEACKKEYTSDEIQAIISFSKKRADQKKLEGRRENYDPEERRAKYQKTQEVKKLETLNRSGHGNQPLKEHKFVIKARHVGCLADASWNKHATGWLLLFI